MNKGTFPISVLLAMSNITVVTVDGSPVLNPFPWSAFLPPRTAFEMETERYILAGVAGVSVPLSWVNVRANEHQAFVWDILNNVREDYLFVAGQTTRWRLPIFVYFLSKYGHLFFCFRSSFETQFFLLKAVYFGICYILCNIYKWVGNFLRAQMLISC
jgi:hypothetical protein